MRGYGCLAGLLVAASFVGVTPILGQAASPADLIVFVGRRIAVVPVGTEVPPQQPFIMDEKFRANYEVVSVLWGDFADSVIEFDVYDHYGEPYFAQFETVLLYVARYGDALVHEKYLFNPVYETASGGWAGCGDPYQLDEPHRGSIEARPVQFKHEVSFSVDSLTEDEIDTRFSAQYFRREGNRVVCLAGATADDLFTIKRVGYLHARGVFR